MIPYLLGTVIVIVIAVVLIAFLKPADYRISRSTLIGAPVKAIVPQIENFHRWEAWSPWEHLDPTMRKTFEGPETGVGAIYAWAGNSKVGEGRMTVVESRAGERLGIKLEFMKPFPSVCESGFTFQPEGQGTRVTWTMSGRHAPVARVMMLFMNMDRMVGGQFERGLEKLRTLVEGSAGRK